MHACAVHATAHCASFSLTPCYLSTCFSPSLFASKPRMSLPNRLHRPSSQYFEQPDRAKKIGRSNDHRVLFTVPQMYSSHLESSLLSHPRTLEQTPDNSGTNARQAITNSTFSGIRRMYTHQHRSKSIRHQHDPNEHHCLLNYHPVSCTYAQATYYRIHKVRMSTCANGRWPCPGQILE